jgi:hypothetical protein
LIKRPERKAALGFKYRLLSFGSRQTLSALIDQLMPGELELSQRFQPQKKTWAEKDLL